MKVPILKFKDLDEMLDFNIENQDMIHLKTFETLKREWIKNKIYKDVELFKIYLTDDPELVSLTLCIFSDEWVKALNVGLKHFENKEEYEICNKVNELLISIKNN